MDFENIYILRGNHMLDTLLLVLTSFNSQNFMRYFNEALQ